ncbi:MAG: efflux RND transporter periplasmic adaptor subunit [Desulfomonilaceae bacterium]
MNMPRFVFRHAVTIGLIAAFWAVAGCSKKESFEKPPIPVKVQTVTAALPAAGLKYSATLVPREQVNLAFKVGGYVEDILKLPGPDGTLRDVQKGDRVEKSAILARIRDTDYQAKLNHANSSLEEAKATLWQAIREFGRYETLFKEDALSKNEFDKYKEKLDVARARVTGAESQVEQAKIDLQDTVLRSPLDALMVNRFVERGTLVASGTKAFLLEDLSSVKAVVGVPDYLLKEVKPGNSLTITVEALQNKEFNGIITAVSPSADQRSRVFEVEITVPNPDLELKDGMIGTVKLAGTGQDDAGPVVPLHAVVRPPSDPQGYMVFVLEKRGANSIARGRKVSIGRVFGNKVVILHGLVTGEQIVTTGATMLSDGCLVDVIP